MRAKIRGFLLLSAAACAGCAFPATSRLLKAGTIVESAEHADAEKHALYEITKAREYLHKAREEYGYADYEIASRYADEAHDWGEKALEKAREHPSDVPSATPPVAPTPGAPAAPPTGPSAPATAPQPTVIVTPQPSGN